MYLSSPIPVATLARLALQPVVWTSWLPVPKIVAVSYVHPQTPSLRTTGSRTDKRKALIGLWAVETGCVKGFVEKVEVLEGVAESVADELKVSDCAPFLQGPLLRLSLGVGRSSLALGGEGSGFRGMSGGGVIWRGDCVGGRQGSAAVGRHGNVFAVRHGVGVGGRFDNDLVGRRGHNVVGG
jgi:hypothetical protein